MSEQEKPTPHQQSMDILQGISNILLSGQAELKEFQARINSVKFLENRLNKLNELEQKAEEVSVEPEEA